MVLNGEGVDDDMNGRGSVEKSVQSDSGDEDDEGLDQLKVNKAFAKQFEQKSRIAELQRADDLGLLDDDSDDEEEDEEGEALTHELDFDILKTLSLIRSKDKRIYDERFNPFGDHEGSEEDKEEDGPENEKEPARPLTYKDLLRQRIEKKMNGEVGENDDEDDESMDEPQTSASFTQKVPIYNDDQAKLKKAFKEAAEKISNDESSDENFNERDVLRKKSKTREEIASEEAAFKRYVAEVEAKSKDKKPKGEDVALLEKLFKDEPRDENEAFLRKFVLNRGWVGDGNDENDDLDFKTRIVGIEDDDDEDDKAEQFEAKYNFRFEEPGSDKVPSYPRNDESLIRQKTSSRKRRRQERREKKAEEKRKRIEELKHLKDLKRQELEKRLNESIRMAGIKDPSKITLKPEFLDEEFDAEKFDQKMAEVFNDAYYNEEDDFEPTGEADDEEKVFVSMESDDDEDEDDGWNEVGEQNDDIDNENHKLEQSDEKTQREKTRLIEELKNATLTSRQKRRRRKKLKRRFGVLIEDEEGKPTMSLQDLKDQIIDQELYNLDYEDIIAGGLKTRFKYRKVKPNDFGLSAAEILNATPELLQTFVPLRRMTSYQEEEFTASAKRRKRFRQELKKGMQTEGKEVRKGKQPVKDKSSAKAKKKRKRNRKIKNETEEKTADEGASLEIDVKEKGEPSMEKAGSKDNEMTSLVESKQKKKRKRKRRKKQNKD